MMKILSSRAATRAVALTFLAVAGLTLAACDTISNMFEESKEKLPGKRVSVLSLDSKLEPDPALKSVNVTLPPPFANPAWPDAGGYPSHAMYHLALPDSVTVAWRENIGDGASRYGRILAQPVVQDGRIFAMDAADVVSAYDASNGSRLWRFDPKPEDQSDHSYGGGIAIDGKRLYVATGYGQVISLDAATGREVWRQPLASPAHGAPTVSDGRVFVITVENELDALAAIDGHRLWTHNGLPEPAELLGAASPAALGDIVVVPYSSGEIFALRVDNGRPLWTDNLASSKMSGALSSLADIRGAPVIDRDRVFALSHSGIMVAIDLRTGERVWEQDIGGTHAPWVAGDYVYVLSNDVDLICMTRKDGHIRWVRPLPHFEDEEKKEDPIRWVGPLLAGDRLIAIASTGESLSISPYTGAPLGRTSFPDGVFVNPVVAGKTLYVLTEQADLIALR
jgi:outer membrane protein assembly factor BamB